MCTFMWEYILHQGPPNPAPLGQIWGLENRPPPPAKIKKIKISSVYDSTALKCCCFFSNWTQGCSEQFCLPGHSSAQSSRAQGHGGDHQVSYVPRSAWKKCGDESIGSFSACVEKILQLTSHKKGKKLSFLDLSMLSVMMVKASSSGFHWGQGLMLW